MKAVCETSVNVLTGVKSSDGKVHKTKSRDLENEEIQMYLSKLKELVPFMPKNRKLSKLEVIQYVIDYICDLQYALETHPVRHTSPSSGTQRQPLGVIAPNTIPNTCSAQEGISTTPSHIEKVPASDSRQVSC